LNKKIKMQFPKSSKYDIEWMGKNEMGPNSVWLAEYLTKGIQIEKGMNVLDLGCGRAISSVFIANEFEARVWAADLWISPTENFKMVKELKLEENIYPIYTEAHNLPFAEEFFDIIVSIDAYHYFGTDEIYLPYITKYLRKGGTIGFISPGLKKEFNTGVPSYLKEIWEPEFNTLHSSEWWKNHFQKTGIVEVEICDTLPNGWEIWYEWEKYLIESKLMNPERGDDLELLNLDKGRNLCFPRIIAKKL